MQNTWKYTIISTISIILVIPIFFGVFIEFLFIRHLNIIVLLISLFSFLSLFILGKLIVNYGFNSQNIKIMKKHDVIRTLINDNNKLMILVFFSITMIMEELIFRYYLISILLFLFKIDLFLIVLISSIIFSLYHIHSWVFFKNLTILLIYLIFAFLLGLFNGFVFLTLGIIPCIIIHSTIAFLFYYNIFTSHFKIK